MKHHQKATNELSSTLSIGSKKLSRYIIIQGAREHNLKDISIDIPKNQLVVITGPSGSGKSTLAFDTIFAEGQRRYIECLSAYAKQFVEQLKRPDIDSISGLSPSVSIQQKNIAKNPRSTVGTITEIQDYLRLLYSRVGEAFCPHCHLKISTRSIHEIAEQIQQLPDGSKLNIMAVIARSRKGEFKKEIDDLVRKGLVRARIDGQDYSLEKGQKLEKNKPHTLEIYVDRIILKEAQFQRLFEAIETASTLGTGQIQVECLDKNETLSFNKSLSCPECGYSISEMTPRLFSFNSPLGACSSCKGLGYLSQAEDSEDQDTEKCRGCEGTRLNQTARSVKINRQSIDQINELSIDQSLEFFESLSFKGNQKLISDKIIHAIQSKLRFLNQVGLNYLQLSRLSKSLSGGEEQRVRLATQLGIQLTGVLYILDEPTIGLHPIDNAKLIRSLKELRDMGNTVIVVEHDLETITASDFVIDLGPGAGRHGGHLIEYGKPKALKKGLTADFLRGRKSISFPPSRRMGSSHEIHIKGAHRHNLKNINVCFPLEKFIVVTGISGSGKSSLIMEVLSKSIKESRPIHCDQIKGLEYIESVTEVTQSAIGRTSRSNPATYIGVFSIIRDLFAKTPTARKRGYSSSRFSFNVEGGRCESCQGAGELKMEMHFLPDVSVPCETCYGQRYNKETLDCRFKSKNIHEVLEMTFEEASEFFSAIPSLKAKLDVILKVGLGYLKLGQAATTLSGGEAQRVKLAKELSKKRKGKQLIILDEPTTGLHLADIQKLLDICHQLVDQGHTLLMIEHHTDIIESADHIIDLGPYGGDQGGKLVAEGTPEEVASNTHSLTAKYIKNRHQVI